MLSLMLRNGAYDLRLMYGWSDMTPVQAPIRDHMSLAKPDSRDIAQRIRFDPRKRYLQCSYASAVSNFLAMQSQRVQR